MVAIQPQSWLVFMVGSGGGRVCFGTTIGGNCTGHAHTRLCAGQSGVPPPPFTNLLTQACPAPD
eukprot:jgi/Mesvir1/25489/Mv01747-RA.1